MNGMQTIVPSLWFDKDCEEAVNFYVENFEDSPHRRAESKVISITRYEKGMEVPGGDDMMGKVLTAIFELDGSLTIRRPKCGEEGGNAWDRSPGRRGLTADLM